MRNDDRRRGVHRHRVLRDLVEAHVFHPTGAPAVRLRFQMGDGRAEALSVEDGPLRITGTRISE